MNAQTFDLNKFKQTLQSELIATSSNNTKRDLSNYRIILSDYLHTRDEVDDEYEYLQEALAELPNEPNDIVQYRGNLIFVIDQMLGYNDPNLDNNHLQGIKRSLNEIRG